MIHVYAFGSVPPFAKGLVRDLRVRWALEEAGLPYSTRLVGDRAGQVSPDKYLKVQPFGQVPTLEDGDFRLFESGAIVQHIAERSASLLPKEDPDRSHVIQWMFSALNTIEVPIMSLADIDFFYPDEGWAKEKRPLVVKEVQQRLAQLATALKGRDHLVKSFSAADILMVTVLRALRETKLVEEQPELVAYKQRCEARPGFQKALAAQLADFVD